MASAITTQMETATAVQVKVNKKTAATKTTATKTTASVKSATIKSAKKSTEEDDLAQKYQKKTDKQHVLDAPDTYTGSMTMTDYDTFVMKGDAKGSTLSNP